MEVPWRDGRLTSNLHWDGYGKDHKHAGTNFSRPGVMKGWHTFGLLWLPTEYVFYVDGAGNLAPLGGRSLAGAGVH